jgi:hypothetical protein
LQDKLLAVRFGNHLLKVVSCRHSPRLLLEIGCLDANQAYPLNHCWLLIRVQDIQGLSADYPLHLNGYYNWNMGRLATHQQQKAAAENAELPDKRG